MGATSGTVDQLLDVLRPVLIVSGAQEHEDRTRTRAFGSVDTLPFACAVFKSKARMQCTQLVR